MVRRVAAAFLLALSCACSLVVSTSGLREEGSDEGTDASLDVSARPEGSPPVVDAGVEAAPAEAGMSVCAVAHAFCDDFDTGGSDVAKRWDRMTTLGGQLVLDTSRARSAPRALRMNVEARTDQRSLLGKVVSLSNRSARVELDIYVPTPAGSYAELDPIGVALLPTPAGFGFMGFYLMIRRDTGTALQYFGEHPDGGGYDRRTPVAFPFDVWHHLAFSFTYATTPPIGTLTVDGTLYAVTMYEPFAPTQLELQVGAPYTENMQTTWSLSFDNVTVDTP